MMTKNEPKLRFKGFTDAWEQRKLKHEAIFTKGSGYSKADLSDEGLPLILYGRLYTNYESEITKVDTFASQKSGSVFSSGNEVIVPASGETAEDIARASAVKVKGCMLGGDLNILMPKNNIDSTFLAISISNGEVSKKLACMAQGKSVVHIHNSDIEQLEIPFPSLTEQVRIVGVFRHIDTLITLHQRKLEMLKKLKQALLQKMFPADGESTPVLRFKDFTDAWEQRKLGDICTDFQYGLNAAATQFDGTNKYLRITDIDDDTHLFLADDLSSPLADLNSSNEFLMHEGEIVFARTGASVGKTYIYKEIDGKVYFAGFLIRAKVKQSYDADFVFQNTLTDNYKKFVVITSQRSGQPGINAKEYGTLEFKVPQLEEQKKISRTLCSIDNLITLHQRKLEILKSLKTALLEKMFPEG